MCRKQEKENSFRYVTKEELIININEIVENENYKTFDEDFVVFNIYIIENEIEFNFDYMGSLNHIHADKFFFERYTKHEISFL